MEDVPWWCFQQKLHQEYVWVLQHRYRCEFVFSFISFHHCLEEFIEKFEIHENMGPDALLQFKQELYCLKDHKYALKVCGPVNPSRKYGVVHEVRFFRLSRSQFLLQILPLGSFAVNGKVYRYHDIPQYAIQLDGHLQSTGKRDEFGTQFACSQISDETCTLGNFYNCPLRIVPSPETVYVKEVQDHRDRP